MLSCGEASPVAWSILQHRADAFIAIDDEAACRAVEALKDCAATGEAVPIDAGPSGAAGLGENWDVFYLRDKEGRELDFVVTRKRRVNWLIEVKASDGDVSTALKYYTQKLKSMESLQLVLNLERPQEKSGIKLLPLGKWLDALPFAQSEAPHLR